MRLSGRSGYNIVLHVFSSDGKIVCSEITPEDTAEEPAPSSRRGKITQAAVRRVALNAADP